MNFHLCYYFYNYIQNNYLKQINTFGQNLKAQSTQQMEMVWIDLSFFKQHFKAQFQFFLMDPSSTNNVCQAVLTLFTLHCWSSCRSVIKLPWVHGRKLQKKVPHYLVYSTLQLPEHAYRRQKRTPDMHHVKGQQLSGKNRGGEGASKCSIKTVYLAGTVKIHLQDIAIKRLI